MIDSLTALAFAIYSQPGVYAVLIGSGVSQPARIPTGWGIVNELLRELAATRGETIGGEPADWFRRTFGAPVGFSALLRELAPLRSDRRALIARFIEPDAARPGDRRPTAAHRALARLARLGFIGVFLSTNFDHLLEQALADEGIAPLVVANPHQAAGAGAFQHADVVVFKLHGDYLDPDSMLATEDELRHYRPAVAKRLGRTLEDYGLIVCGWSGEWDPALRAAMSAASARRYPLYFAARNDPGPETAIMIRARDGIRVTIEDADGFFGRLTDECQSLVDLDRSHPLSASTAVATAKRELMGGRVAISLHDSIRHEMDSIRQLDVYRKASLQPGSLLQWLDRLEAKLEPLLALVATAAYWGSPSSDQWWLGDIVRFAFRQPVSGDTALLDIPRVPAVALLWTGGVAAVASERDDLLVSLLRLGTVEPTYGGPAQAAALVLNPEVLHTADGIRRLYRIVRLSLVDHLGIGRDLFLDAWERWQCLLLMLAWDARLTDNVGAVFNPHLRVDTHVDEIVPVALDWLRNHVLEPSGRHRHPLFKAGLFGGDPARANRALKKFQETYSAEAQRKDSKSHSSDGSVFPSGRHYPGRWDDDPDV